MFREIGDRASAQKGGIWKVKEGRGYPRRNCLDMQEWN